MFYTILYVLFGLAVSSSVSLIEYPPCNSSSSASSFGSIEIENNLLSDTLTLHSQSVGAYSLIPLSIRIVLLDRQNTVLLYKGSIPIDRINLSLPFTGGQCQRLYRVILLLNALLNVSEGEEKIVLSSAPTLNQSIGCDLLPTMGFDCNKTPSIYYVEHQLSNCLVTADDGYSPNATITTERQIHSPLYWYAQYLTNGNITTEYKASHVTLCGEPLHTILYRSDLYLNQCDDFHGPIRSAWYRMAIQVVTVVCNDVPDEYKWICEKKKCRENEISSHIWSTRINSSRWI